MKLFKFEKNKKIKVIGKCFEDITPIHLAVWTHLFGKEHLVCSRRLIYVLLFDIYLFLLV